MMNERPDNYEVEDALKTLVRAEEIKKDKSLLDEVIKYAQKQKAAISSIADLKRAYDESLKKEEEDDAEGEESEKSSESKEVEEGKVDPLLEENTYIARVERANKEAKAPSEIPVVKLADE